MRVALVHAFTWPHVRRGGERYLHDLGWYLSRAGHEVDIIAGTWGRRSVEASQAGTIRRHRNPYTRHLRRWTTPVETFGLAAAKVLTTRRYDVVHTLQPTAAAAALATRHPTVHTELGVPNRDWLRARALLWPLWRHVATRAHAVTVLSEHAAEAFTRLSHRRATVLPPGVRLDHFTPDLAPRTGPPRVLFSADASVRAKGLETLVEAFGGLLHDHPDARLWISGPGDPRWAFAGLGPRGDAVAAATDRLGPGELSDIPGRYRQATVTVLPSTAEAFGLSLVESLATGTPVVASAHGGPSEIVDGRQVGRVAAYGDAEALRTALGEAIALAAEPATPQHCVERARAFGWETIGPMHEHVYRAIAASHRGAPTRRRRAA
jgi:glycosyltransferase involved in cell wall biosynthesis